MVFLFCCGARFSFHSFLSFFLTFFSLIYFYFPCFQVLLSDLPEDNMGNLSMQEENGSFLCSLSFSLARWALLVLHTAFASGLKP
jgi:hypothetical protein